MTSATDPAAVAALVGVLEHFEPDGLRDASDLLYVRLADSSVVLAAWEVYHHDRGRGWN